MNDTANDKVLISVGNIKIEAQLLDTPTARNIRDSLPFGSKAKLWGGQVMFETPVMAEAEDDARDVIKAGELAFSIEDSSIAITFGKTPAAEGDEIRLASKSNIWALCVTDVTLLKSAKEDDFIFIESLV